MVHAVRESVFYETSADPIRFSLLGLDLITRRQSDTPLVSAETAGKDKEEAEEREEGTGEEGGKGRGNMGAVAGLDRWFFTFLLCKLLSG